MTFLRSRRTFLAATAATLAAPAVRADDRPLQIVVGYGPGGGSDVLARLLAVPLAKTAGRQVVVRNVAGAGGQIAASTVLREGQEGLSILAINHPDLAMAAARGNAGFRTSDFQTLLVDLRDPRILLVKAGSDIDSFATLVNRARAQPGRVAVSVATGSAQELFGKWLFNRLGVDVTLVGYKGGAESSNALLAGDVAASIGDDFARLNLRQQVRALCVGAGSRSPRWPEAPTLASVLQPFSVALPSPDFLTRYGVYVVPAAFKQKSPAGYAALQKAMLDARAGAEFQAYIQKNQLQDLSIGKPGEAFEAAFAADAAEIARLS